MTEGDFVLPLFEKEPLFHVRRGHNGVSGQADGRLVPDIEDGSGNSDRGKGGDEKRGEVHCVGCVWYFLSFLVLIPQWLTVMVFDVTMSVVLDQPRGSDARSGSWRAKARSRTEQDRQQI